MNEGIIFDIKEFSVNDGPGGRVTVFLKGCPLKCMWCHNPEGIDPKLQYNSQTKKMVGTHWSVKEIVSYMEKYNEYFTLMHGGITFSGGEPTFQYDFLMECAQQLQRYHLLLDTSGYCEPEKFKRLAEVFDMFYFDLKLANEDEHVKYTGVSNEWIIDNLRAISQTQKEIVIRIPMIPRITDTEENLAGLEYLIKTCCSNNKTKIHVLPYNVLAGGKYPIYNMKYPLENWFTKNNIKNIDRFVENMSDSDYRVTNYVKGDCL